jgi:hypothetical protein
MDFLTSIIIAITLGDPFTQILAKVCVSLGYSGTTNNSCFAKILIIEYYLYWAYHCVNDEVEKCGTVMYCILQYWKYILRY